MGFLISLGVEIARAIKKKKEDKTMSPEQLFIRDNPINVKNKEAYLNHIDIFIKNKEQKWVIEGIIEKYIRHHSKDTEIIKRIKLVNKMKDE